MTAKHDDFVPVTGGVSLADVYVRHGLELSPELKVRSELDLHLVRLSKLHPDVRVAFRNQDLATLDDGTKKGFVQDLNDLLGIKPLQPGRK
jgi:hypothetical protein